MMSTCCHFEYRLSGLGHCHKAARVERRFRKIALLRRALAIDLLILGVGLRFAAHTSAQAVEESQVKAAYLNNFAKFLEWPPGVFGNPADPAVICVIGDELLINAAHAIGEKVGDDSGGKGTITITTRRDGRWAEVQIHDTGMGIPENIRARIFEPFFTTKGFGKGTGQGLALAHAVVVKKHDGQIWFESEAGSGATFFLCLPLGLSETVACAAATANL
jgi:hypothetical protein